MQFAVAFIITSLFRPPTISFGLHSKIIFRNLLAVFFDKDWSPFVLMLWAQEPNEYSRFESSLTTKILQTLNLTRLDSNRLDLCSVMGLGDSMQCTYTCFCSTVVSQTWFDSIGLDSVSAFSSCVINPLSHQYITDETVKLLSLRQTNTCKKNKIRTK
jgi:hypothetical protein